MLQRKFVLLTIFLSLWTFKLNPIIAADPADWGDVVDVNYSLWLDEQHTIPKEGNIDVDLQYIYLRRDPNEAVPSEVLAAFPQSVAQNLQQPYIQGFTNAIIGMRINQEKNFMIAAEDHDLSDEDFYYHIKLLTILYDVSEHAATTTTTTTTIPGSSTPYQGLTELLIFGGAAVVLGGGFILWRYRISRTYKSLAREEIKSVKQAKTFQKEKDHLRELRKLTESVADSDATPEKSEVKFRPRRR